MMTLQSIVRDPAFQEYVIRLLVEICRIDTTPSADIEQMHAQETRVFEILERELANIPALRPRVEHRPISVEIADDPAFSQLHFTKTPQRPDGQSPSEVYAKRGNLLFFVDGTTQTAVGINLAINAHIDVVAPFFPPRIRDGIVYGRGACDDKGNVVAMIAAINAIGRLCDERGCTLNRDLVGMIVVEEETGGNGSLALALDRELRSRYDALLVLECCDNQIFPANRGAVWYRIDVAAPAEAQLEVACCIIDQLELEGRALRAESRHALFPQRPVQTCHGKMGPFGEHPSRICGHAQFQLVFAESPRQDAMPLVVDCLDAAVAEYCGLYGDKTKELDPATGAPKVRQHYQLRCVGSTLDVDVFGSSGHMGSIREHDGAITKMATMVRMLTRAQGKLEMLAGCSATLQLAGARGEPCLTLEGGQGFVPTHDIGEIMQRITVAAQRGVAVYRAANAARGTQPCAVSVSFDKLHNAAYDGDPRSREMQMAVDVARRHNMWPPDRAVVGWTVSCDARLFANQHPGLPVLTCGTGKLAHAHSDDEQLAVADLLKFIEFLADYLLEATATSVG